MSIVRKLNREKWIAGIFNVVAGVMTGLFIVACGHRTPATYIDYSDETDEDVEEVYKIPFRQDESGVKYITVHVNGVAVDMIFDSGCSGVQLSTSEVIQLAKRGAITDDDVTGASMATIADGSVQHNVMVNLRTVEIGTGLMCEDVPASISENLVAPALIGNEIFDRAESVTTDNVNHTINLTLYK